MQETIYKCDRCGKEIILMQGSGKLLVHHKKIQLFDNLFGRDDSSHYRSERFDLCKKCYGKLVKFMKEVQEDE